MVFVQLRNGKSFRTKGGKKYKSKRAYNRRGVNTSVVKAALGFPDRMITKLEYRTSIDLNSEYGTIETNDYRLNSIYDPEITSTGHQPMWRDQYSLIYQKYRVFKATYEIKLVPISSNGTPIRVVTIASADPTLPLDIATAWEQNRTENRLVPPGPDTIVTLRGSVNMPKLQGQTAVAFKGDDGNFAFMSTNPTNRATLRFLMASANGTTAENKWLADVKITYHVEIFDRLTPDQS